jgi:outer membrane lipoprotein-sorting protein
MRLCIVVAWIGLSVVLNQSAPGAPGAQEVLDKVLHTYSAMETYSAEGTVIVDMDTDQGKVHDVIRFSATLKKPNLYRITWSKEDAGATISGAVWNSGDGPRIFWGTRTYRKMPDDVMALACATALSEGAVRATPALFFPNLRAPLAGGLLLKDPVIEKTETIDGEECYVVSGLASGNRRERVWVSTSRYLVVQTTRALGPPEGVVRKAPANDREPDEARKATGKEPSPDKRPGGLERTRKTIPTIYQGVGTLRNTGIVMPEVKTSDCAFTVPDGVTLTDWKATDTWPP